ncbi:MAG: tRNA (N6-threonylcarbamoyladenosine(37)-N6)-methyltransferase TrmO [Candidatus Bathyarchaeota archaeon]
MTEAKEIKLEPIGYVKRKTKSEDVRDRSLTTRVVVEPEYLEALDGIEDYSHLFVIFFMHEISRKRKPVLKVHPRRRSDIRLQGIFATRSPQRPNPIGLTLVQLVERKQNILVVKGLDAYDETPVLDLKPYDHWDMAADIVVPEWREKLEKSSR